MKNKIIIIMILALCSATAWTKDCSKLDNEFKHRLYNGKCTSEHMIEFSEYNKILYAWETAMYKERLRREKIIDEKYGINFKTDYRIEGHEKYRMASEMLINTEFPPFEDVVGERPIYNPKSRWEWLDETDKSKNNVKLKLIEIDRNGDDVNPDHFCKNHYPRHFIGKKIDILDDRNQLSNQEDERVFLYKSTGDIKHLSGLNELDFKGVDEQDYHKVIKNVKIKYLMRVQNLINE